ncbi:MAG TPA: hypothetical protein VJ385_17700 [Fibrobacteria bacterium]|nr:hypothetical protein [Fibrobacteria bacterium]
MHNKTLISKLPGRSLGALTALALFLSVPANAGKEWDSHRASNDWTIYNYLDYARQHNANTPGSPDWGLDFFGNTQYKYFLNYVDNFTTEGHCYEIEIKAPENHPNDPTNVQLFFWDQAQGAWSDLLGYYGNGPARLFLKNSEFQVFIATYSFSNTKHAGYWLSRKNLTESQCTTGQTTMNWLKIIDGAQTKNLILR